MLGWALAAVTAGLALASVLLFDIEDTGTRSPETATTTPASKVPTYDLDGDGLPEFAVIRGEVVAVPADPPDEDSSSWLPFAGTVLAAIIGGLAILGVAFVNRQGGEQLGLLEERVARLEAARPGEDDAVAP